LQHQSGPGRGVVATVRRVVGTSFGQRGRQSKPEQWAAAELVTGGWPALRARTPPKLQEQRLFLDQRVGTDHSNAACKRGSLGIGTALPTLAIGRDLPKVVPRG
jgi:hypothetical protein